MRSLTNLEAVVTLAAAYRKARPDMPMRDSVALATAQLRHATTGWEAVVKGLGALRSRGAL